MNNNKIRFSFMILLTFVICAVPISWLIVKQPSSQVSLIEARYLNTFPLLDYQSFRTSLKRMLKGNINEASSVFWGQFFDRSFQKKVENATSDQFPFRLPLIQFSKAIDRKVIELAYSSFSDPAVPAEMNSGFYVMRDKSRLIAGPGIFDKETKNSIDKRINNLESIANQNPEKKFYVFYYERLIFSKYHPLNEYFSNSDRGQAFDYFRVNKPTNVKLGALLFSGFDDLVDDYYKTDHHWNIQGIRSAYSLIYATLSQNNSDISPAVDLKNIYTIPNIKFFGSYARKTMYPISGENFEVAKINFPPYKILEGGRVKEGFKWGKYFQGNYSTEKFTNYYGKSFGESSDLMEYVFENGSDRNLLLIGSSFTRPLIPLLAYHFNHTYYVDLRFFKDFSLSEFTSTHPVDDVIIVADTAVLTGNEWMINP